MFKIFVAILAVLAVVSSSPTLEKRIVGGNQVALGQVPSIVSIRPLHSTNHFAAGVLISPIWLLTTAFYIVDRAATSLHIMMGIVDLNASGTLRQSLEIVIHSNYNRLTRENDIACVRITAVTFNANIQSIFMDPYFVSTATTAQVSGWGGISSGGGANSQFLRRLTVTTRTTCTPNTNDGSLTLNQNAHICAQGATDTGFCTSDVGGPLIANGELIGIASWHRNPCGTAEDVYLRISFYRNWIRSITLV